MLFLRVPACWPSCGLPWRSGCWRPAAATARKPTAILRRYRHTALPPHLLRLRRSVCATLSYVVVRRRSPAAVRPDFQLRLADCHRLQAEFQQHQSFAAAYIYRR